jgi:hypothetical protein
MLARHVRQQPREPAAPPPRYHEPRTRFPCADEPPVSWVNIDGPHDAFVMEAVGDTPFAGCPVATRLARSSRTPHIGQKYSRMGRGAATSTCPGYSGPGGRE